MPPRKPRKAPRKRVKERQAIDGTPPIPSIVTPEPKPSVWQRIKRAIGW